MKNEFSSSWISSTKPNKQRKYRFNAPLHINGNFMSSHLSKELRAKYSTRAVRVRVGDKVRILRGQFKKLEGKVEEINMKTLKVYVAKVEVQKRDGSKTRYPIDPSNVMIVELNLDDKKRFKERTVKKADASAKPKTVKTTAPKADVKKDSPKAPAKKAKSE